MEPKIKIVGIGPGTEDYLLPIARKTAEAADVLIGGKRALDLFNSLGKETLVITGKLAPVLDYLKLHGGKKRIVVLVSGDPGFYSMLTYLSKHFGRENLEVIPGISSVQLAFARLAETWQDAELNSFHGRDPAAALAVLAEGKKKKFAFLTDPEHTPQKAAAILLDKGIEVKKAVVCQNLGYPDEALRERSLNELAEDKADYPNSVLVLELP